MHHHWHADTTMCMRQASAAGPGRADTGAPVTQVSYLAATPGSTRQTAQPADARRTRS